MDLVSYYGRKEKVEVVMKVGMYGKEWKFACVVA